MRIAKRVRSAAFLALILHIARIRWQATVLIEMPRACATPFVDSPKAMSFTTSTSRGVRCSASSEGCRNAHAAAVPGTLSRLTISHAISSTGSPNNSGANSHRQARSSGAGSIPSVTATKTRNASSSTDQCRIAEQYH